MKICGKRGKWNKTLDFLKMIFYFLNSKSTTWGIYREYIYIYMYIYIYWWFLKQIHETSQKKKST